MTNDRFTLVLAASAERKLQVLPSRIAMAIVEFMVGPLLENPFRVGKPLRRELTGRWSARRGTYRVIYEVDHDQLIVRVLHLDHRSDAYRAR